MEQDIQRASETKIEYVKRRTVELYDSLPQDEVERKKHVEVRDKVIELNYSFFGYVASHTFINDPCCEYEDKLASCLQHFCECWWWYKWEKRYRTDLAFTVFFKPRLGEMIERELNIVKYSTRRTICMKIGDQLGKHWGKVTYEDIAKVKLSPADAEAAQYIFNVMYPQDLKVAELYIPGDSGSEADNKFNELLSDNYETVEELLLHEMIDAEKKLSEGDLKKISTVQDIPMEVLYKARPVAEQMLYKRLKSIQQYREDMDF